MDIQTIVTTGGLLVGFVGALYAALKSTNIKVLRESNLDYKERNAQLDATIVIQADQIHQLQQDVTELKRQKQLPFENLTNMLVKQHTEQAESINSLAIQIGTLAKEIAKQNRTAP